MIEANHCLEVGYYCLANWQCEHGIQTYMEMYRGTLQTCMI